MTKATVTTVVSSSPATVMIASPSGIQQGQVVQLPIGQITSPQLAAQLTKAASTSGAAGQSGIPVVQVCFLTVLLAMTPNAWVVFDEPK